MLFCVIIANYPGCNLKNKCERLIFVVHHIVLHSIHNRLIH